MSNALSRKLVLLLIIPLLGLIYIAANWGIADIYYRPAKNQIKSWNQGKINLDDKDWDSLLQRLSKAVEFDPGNSDIHEYLGIAYEGQYSKNNPGDTEAKENRQKALEHYRQSALLRPSWPYVWNNLMLVKFRLNQIDGEFLEAFHNAERLGPWEPGIQRMVIDVGLIVWPKLSREDRSFVMNTIANSLEKQPWKTLYLVKKHGLLDVVCFIHKDKLNINKQCEQLKK